MSIKILKEEINKWNLYIKALEWLLENKNKIYKKVNEPFEYPWYWGMPGRISDELDSEVVDRISENTWDWVDWKD